MNDETIDTIDFGSGITATPTALLFEDAPPYEVWAALGKRLQLHGRAIQWWLGDWLTAGERVYGESYTQAIDETGYSYGSLANFAYVADRFEFSRRRENVPWSFHADCAALEADQADDLLDQADQGRQDEPDEWTEVKFRAKVRHAKSGYEPDSKGYDAEPPTSQEHVRLATGDRVDMALLESSHWPDGEVDLLLTSPPYGVGIQYSGGGDVEDYIQYMEMISLWAREITRLINPKHGRAAINIPIDRSDTVGKRGRPSYKGRPILADWTCALVDTGCDYRSTILWHDGQAGEGNQRGSVDSPAAPHVVAPAEAIILVYRGSWSRTSERAHDLAHQQWLEELGPRGLWEINGESDRSEHPAPWPPELPERLIRLLSFRSDVVADPMCGRGTAGVIAARLGRKVWMADRSTEYVEVARRALAEARGLAEPKEVAA